MSGRLQRAEADGLLSDPGTTKGRLQRVVLAALERHEAADELPTVVRFLFYEEEQAGNVSKVRTGARRADQDFQEAATHLREAGVIPWDWILDDTRTLHVWRSAPSVAEYLAETVDEARVDPWIGTSHPVVITESRAVAGVFERSIAYGYLAPIAPTNGQARGFLINVVAPVVSDPDTRVLYVGDLDLSGGVIEANTRRVLTRDRPHLRRGHMGTPRDHRGAGA